MNLYSNLLNSTIDDVFVEVEVKVAALFVEEKSISSDKTTVENEILFSNAFEFKR